MLRNALIPIVTVIIGVYQTLLSNQVGQSVMHDLRAQVYRHLQRLSLAGIVEEGLKSLDFREHLLWVTHQPGGTGLTVPTSSDFPA